MGNEGRRQFEEGGGQAANYALAPCLNAHPRWLDAAADMIRANAQGWTQA